MPSPRPVRIANCSGFYGDRLSAMAEMVDGGPIDVLTGDYLAELTMLILAKGRRRDPDAGWARTFLAQLEGVLGPCLDHDIKVVTNAGGLAPAALAGAVRELAARLGLSCRVAHIEGDDLLGDLDRLRADGVDLANLDTGEGWDDLPGEALTANAYLGGWGVAAALTGGADVVVCPRVTDASVVVGPAAWWHGWSVDDWDALAGAIAAGHAVECGAQVTGGNYSFFTEVSGLEHPGFPIAEVAADGSSVITKHPGTGGTVTVETVTAQLLYEIDGPRYAGPDVVTRFDTIALGANGPDRVSLTGTRGEPPPPDLKVCVNCEGGYRNSVTFVLTGLDLDAKADLARRSLLDGLGGADRFATVDVRRTALGTDRVSQEGASELLTITVTDPDRTAVGRAFSGAAIELALANYPGFFVTAPPADATAVGIYWPTLVPADRVAQVVVHADGRREPIAHSATTAPLLPVPETEPGEPPPPGPARTVPLGTVAGARSGDKGGNANVGVWARTDATWAWLRTALTVDCFRELVPEATQREVARHELPNLRAVNFVVAGLLDRGVAATTRFDPQAKALGEWLRSRPVEIPETLLPPTRS